MFPSTCSNCTRLSIIQLIWGEVGYDQKVHAGSEIEMIQIPPDKES